jgi:hypothetical protein
VFPVGRGFRRYVDAALEDDVKAVADIAFAEKHGAFRKRSRNALFAHRGNAFLGEVSTESGVLQMGHETTFRSGGLE